MRKLIFIIILIIPTQFFGQKSFIIWLETTFYSPYILAGNSLYNQGNYDTALVLYSIPYQLTTGCHPKNIKTIEKVENPIVLTKYHWWLINIKLGQIYYYLGENLNSIKFLTSIERLLSQQKNTQRALTKCYYFLGLANSKEHNYNKGLEYYFKCQKIYKSIGLNESNEAGYLFINIGNIFGNQGEYEKALEYFNKALSVLQNQDSVRIEKVSIIINNIGSVHYALGDIKKAKEHYLKAITLLENAKTNPNSDLSMYYNNLAGIYSLQENYDLAEYYFFKSLKIRNIALAKNQLNKSQSYYQLSLVNYYQGDYKSALNWAEKSINCNTYLKYPSSKENIEFDNITNYHLMASALLLRANIYQNICYIDTNLSYRLTSDAFDYLLSFYNYINKKIAFNNNYNQLANIQKDGINAAISFLSYKTFDDYSKKERLFNIIEQGKSMELLKILIESDAKSFSSIPDSLISLEKTLKRSLVDNGTELSIAKTNNMDTDDPESYLVLLERRSHIQVKLDSLVGIFERKYREYFELIYNNKIPTINHLQSFLDDSTALIEYYCGNSGIYSIIITKTIFEIYYYSIDSLRNTVKNHIRNISFYDNHSLAKSSTYLYEVLFSSLKNHLVNINKIIIIPDDYLYYLPFETLASFYNSNTNKLRFLVQDFEICYQHSSAIWQLSFNRQINKINKQNNFLGIAPFSNNSNQSDANASIQNLPFSKKEVLAIKELFLNYGYDAIVLLDSNASKDNLKNYLPQFKYIHIASHGNYNHSNPEMSSIILSMPSNCKIQDTSLAYQVINQNLYIRDSYNLDLNAELVVLSSCKSGIGDFDRGESFISLTRGFFFSGAKNVLFSVWNVKDKPTNILMQEFYNFILLGDSPSRALRKAKILLLSNPRTSLPIFWGGLLLLSS